MKFFMVLMGAGATICEPTMGIRLPPHDLSEQHRETDTEEDVEDVAPDGVGDSHVTLACVVHK